MKYLSICAVIVVLICLNISFIEGRDKIQNVHLAFAGNAQNNMVVSWKTKDQTKTSTVQYGTSSGVYSNTVTGFSNSYDSGAGWNNNAKLTNLQPDTTYYYICGDADYAWSEEYSFITESSTFSPFKFAIYGDMGVDNSKDVISSLLSNAKTDDYKFVVHKGDMSYANDHPLRYEHTWDSWFEKLEPLMATKAYMAAPGNHESWSRTLSFESTKNFTTFKQKFLMPGFESGTNTNMFYSWDYQNVHFISISTESDYPGAPLDPSPMPLAERRYLLQQEYQQLNWVEQDLIKANNNRANVPWIFVYGHRPIYSPNKEDDNDPDGQAKKVQAWLEPMLSKYKVDIYFSGHTHNYARSYPTLNNQVVSTNFTNPPATTYVVCGAAGNVEGHQPIDKYPDWLAFSNDKNYGYGYVNIINNTHLDYGFIDGDTNTILDGFHLIQESHP